MACENNEFMKSGKHQESDRFMEENNKSEERNK
jgi:hypothetical protein